MPLAASQTIWGLLLGLVLLLTAGTTPTLASQSEKERYDEIGKLLRQGDIHAGNRQYEAAERLYRDALNLMQFAVLSSEQNKTVAALWARYTLNMHLAGVEHKLGKFDLAALHYAKAADIMKTQNKSLTEDACLAMEGMVEEYIAQGRYAEANRVLEQLITHQRSQMSPGHGNLRPPKAVLSSLLKTQSDILDKLGQTDTANLVRSELKSLENSAKEMKPSSARR
jgi:tetratricopeptide (TPR) repeat protein